MNFKKSNLVKNTPICVYVLIAFLLLILLFKGYVFNKPQNYLEISKEIENASISASSKNIALTFDDGPYGTSTEKILDILKAEKINATFFVIGKNVEKYPAIAKRIVAEGHLIENHSYDHSKKLREMSLKEFGNNTKKAESIIFNITGLKPKLFRPPYGNISASMYGNLKANGYISSLWNIDAQDWDFKNASTTYIEKTILQEAKPNGIILMHDGRDTHINYPRENTIDSLAYIIEQLKKEGYVFVTLDKILKTQPYF